MVQTLDVSLDLYKIFCTVVKTGNMSAAAKELYITQPAVSMAVKQLESRLGKPLLIRSPRGIKTTPEGSVLYEYLKQALSLIETAEDKYLSMVNMKIGEVKIGASDTILTNFLLEYIERFMLLYPGINIKATNRTTFETIKLLKNGVVDIGFVNLPLAYDETLEITECMEINDCMIGGTRFKHLAETGINITDIGSSPLMLLENESNTRHFLNLYAQNNGVVFSPNIELGSIDLLVRFAKINLGLTFVVKEFSKGEIDNKVLYEIPISPKIPSRHIGLVKLREVNLSYAAANFVKMFE